MLKYVTSAAHNGMMFDGKLGDGFGVTKVKNRVKSLLIRVIPFKFSQTLFTSKAQSTYFCIFKNKAVEKSNNASESLQFKDFLLPGAVLEAFKLEMNEATLDLLKQTEKKQDELLKIKEIREEQLRMVVKL